MKDSKDHIFIAGDSLTQREREILACLVDGLTNQEIARRLHLSLRTVKWYNTQIYGKLGVSNRKEAIYQAQRLRYPLRQDESEVRHNLPHQLTAFIGRYRELTDLSRLINKKDIRLVTILAPGGMGKTCLALAAAREQLGNFKDGVYLISLASLNAPGSIVTSIAEAIGFSFYGEKPPLQQLTGYLRSREMLLVLDNFEHLLNGALLVSEILRETQEVRILVTSRERLNIHGESLYLLSGLEYPALDSHESAQNFDALKLFIESSCRVRADFTYLPSDLASITRICQLADGMPLGIELAAGWVDVLSVQQIAEEVQHGIDFLETDLLDIPERHRSMRGTFEQTWFRLSDDEKAVYRRLSAFRNGFTFSAAKVVANASLAHLRQFVQKALIMPVEGGRYTIHELLRQFGMGKLAESNELLAVHAMHAALFAEFMVERKHDIKTNRQVEALELIDRDFENICAAWSYLVSHHQWEQTTSFLFSLWFYCDVRGRCQEAIGLLETGVNVLRRLPPSSVVDQTLGRVLAPLGWFYTETGFTEKGAAMSDEAIHLLRQHGCPEDLIIALFDRQGAAFTLYQPGIAIRIAEEGLKIARNTGDKYWEGHFLFWAGSGVQNGMQIIFKNTRQFTELALAIFEELGDRWGIMRANQILGNVLYRDENQYELAKHYYARGLSLAELFAHARSIAGILCHLAQIALIEQDYEAARNHFRRALRVYWDAGYQWLAPYPLLGFAQLFADLHDYDRATMVLATIQPCQLSYGLTDLKIQALREKLAGLVEPGRFDTAWASGQQKSMAALVAEVLDEVITK